MVKYGITLKKDYELKDDESGTANESRWFPLPKKLYDIIWNLAEYANNESQ